MTDDVSSPTQLATPLPDGSASRVIGERYRLLGRLGEGGMGAVYLGEHILMKKTVAIKLLHAELGTIDEAVRRFEREAQSLSRLNHPNIISVTDFGRASTGELFLVMEYVRGHSLAEAIVKAGRLPLARALDIVRQMLRALAHAHGQGVVHRDLKPANVMLTQAETAAGARGEVVKILDFGIAKLNQMSGTDPGEPAAASRQLTQAAMVFGTPSYMSPEQATAQDVDARADLYACGVMLYELCTGKKPFVASDLARILALQVTAKPPSFATSAPDARLPAALEAAVMRALDKDRNRRFQSADEFLAALDSLETAMVPQVLAAQAVTGARVVAARARALGAELRALYDRLPWKLRRFGAAAGVAGVVLVLVIVPSLCLRATREAAAPPPPKAVAPAAQVPVQKAEEAIARGRLAEARAMLLQLLSRHPREARVHYLIGNIEFVERKPVAALQAYGQALDLDPGLRGDAALLLNVRSLLTDRDKRLAWDALNLAARRIGAPAAGDLAAIASDDRRPEFRALAREACARVGCTAKIDLVKSYSQDLTQARACEDKRQAVKQLAALEDPRATDALKKARGVRGVLAGLLGGGNECVRKDIDVALKERGE
jgi:eukaryotic-like serine/threonine-protein kinase